MARIYKRSDRILVRIDDVVVKLAPLTLDQKVEIQQAMLAGRTKSDVKEMTRGIGLAMKYSVKGLDGVIDSDGQPYQLAIENDKLTDECIDDLLNLGLTAKLSMVCAQMVNGIPVDFKDDPSLAGVEVINSEKEQPEKNG